MKRMTFLRPFSLKSCTPTCVCAIAGAAAVTDLRVQLTITPAFGSETLRKVHALSSVPGLLSLLVVTSGVPRVLVTLLFVDEAPSAWHWIGETGRFDPKVEALIGEHAEALRQTDRDRGSGVCGRGKSRGNKGDNGECFFHGCWLRKRRSERLSGVGVKLYRGRVPAVRRYRDETAI